MNARQELIDQAAGYFMVMEMYILRDGQEVAKGQIEQAFAAGNAVLIHGHGDGKTVTGLMLDGRGIDTRNECHSMWDEVWTTNPRTLRDCLLAAGA